MLRTESPPLLTAGGAERVGAPRLWPLLVDGLGTSTGGSHGTEHPVGAGLHSLRFSHGKQAFTESRSRSLFQSHPVMFQQTVHTVKVMRDALG